MESEQKFTLTEAHAHFARTINNEVWGYIEKTERSMEDAERMVIAAFASAYHWLHAGTPLNRQRGEWLISHVLSLTGQGAAAMLHARRCLEQTQAYPDLMQDFDLAYSAEAMARALALDGSPEAAYYRQLAEQAGRAIQGAEDQQIFWSDFNR